LINVTWVGYLDGGDGEYGYINFSVPTSDATRYHQRALRRARLVLTVDDVCITDSYVGGNCTRIGTLEVRARWEGYGTKYVWGDWDNDGDVSESRFARIRGHISYTGEPLYGGTELRLPWNNGNLFRDLLPARRANAT
jgi:hypothetical protein